jgi:hypothetical protein
MRLEMDGDHLPAPGQFGQIAPEAVWVDAPVKKNERLAGAMHAVKDMLAIDVGKIRILHGGVSLARTGGSQSALRSLWQSSGSRVCAYRPHVAPNGRLTSISWRVTMRST